MTNVLPEAAQKKMSRLYRARFLLLGSIAAIVVALVGTLALLPVYAVTRADDVEEVIAPPQLSPEDKSEQIELGKSQTIVRQLIAMASTTAPGFNVLKEVVAQRPKGVLFTALSFAQSAGADSTIMLTGSAPTRETINSFAAQLRADKRFKTVSVPLNVLTGTGADAGRFTITLTGAF
ncbi:MAG: PilN domain-containing protein [Candidatus Kaiserbacteria bacterium]|nr:MAG: PilN domain-containing protein [Candidatus Kaiserbacteria bacterium]